MKALLTAAHDFFDRYDQCPHCILLIIGFYAAKVP